MMTPPLPPVAQPSRDWASVAGLTALGFGAVVVAPAAVIGLPHVSNYLFGDSPEYTAGAVRWTWNFLTANTVAQSLLNTTLAYHLLGYNLHKPDGKLALGLGLTAGPFITGVLGASAAFYSSGDMGMALTASAIATGSVMAHVLHGIFAMTDPK